MKVETLINAKQATATHYKSSFPHSQALQKNLNKNIFTKTPKPVAFWERLSDCAHDVKKSTTMRPVLPKCCVSNNIIKCEYV